MIERVHGHDYRIKLTNRVKMFHANMHKKYTVRESEKEPELHEIAAVVVEEQLNAVSYTHLTLPTNREV